MTRRAALGGIGAAALAGPALAQTGVADIGAKVAREFLSRPNIMMYDTGDVVAVHYAEAATAYGAAKLGGLLGDTALVDEVQQRHLRVLSENIPNTRNHVDANVYGVWPLELYRQGKDPADLAYGLELADGQWRDLRPDGLTTQTRFWIDDMWMIGALQAQAYRSTSNPLYIDRAGRELAAYVEKLQQPNGLFFHGPEAPFHWGRGNGWVAAGLAEVLADLPVGHASYPVVEGGYRKMMDALLQHQSGDGMWRQLVDRAESWPESSCTAMFGFALATGVRRGLLEASARQNVDRAWTALTARLTMEGLLPDVCVGTGQSQDVQYYLDRPRVTGDLHGQAPMLWLAGALLGLS
ncbi:hypothetical protein ABAC460_19810 [Asticcacaulis sp. AC460]|nr:hypothetical protein ABAC460_19810 [Asticcacaulis sp. AC460]